MEGAQFGVADPNVSSNRDDEEEGGSEESDDEGFTPQPRRSGRASQPRQRQQQRSASAPPASRSGRSSTPSTAPQGSALAGRDHSHDCQGGVALRPSKCGMVGCKNQNCWSGCKTCGYRFAARRRTRFI